MNITLGQFKKTIDKRASIGTRKSYFTATYQVMNGR